MIIIDNPRADIPVELPLHSDGTKYRYEMIYDGSASRAYADTMPELIGALIPEYASIATAEEADLARVLFAVRAQVELQAHLIAGAGAGVRLDGDERALLLGRRDTPPAVTSWAHEIPLVLVATYYEPVGPLPRPIGISDPATGESDVNLVWLDPVDEVAFIESLAFAGVITVSELAA